MVKDRIVVFNRLVDKEIADCSVFEELLENHYHKFVYFYSIIESDDLIEYIEDVSCVPQEGRLDIYLTLCGDVDIDDFDQELEDNFGCSYLCEQFDAYVSTEADGTLVISIKD